MPSTKDKILSFLGMAGCSCSGYFLSLFSLTPSMRWALASHRIPFLCPLPTPFISFNQPSRNPGPTSSGYNSPIFFLYYRKGGISRKTKKEKEKKRKKKKKRRDMPSVFWVTNLEISLHPLTTYKNLEHTIQGQALCGHTLTAAKLLNLLLSSLLIMCDTF